MSNPCAHRQKPYLYRFWAYALACTIAGGATSCTKTPPAKVLDTSEQSSMMMDEEDPALSMFDSNCGGGKDQTTPVLYAHFLETTLKDEICFTDVITNKSGSINCAPGPFLIERKNTADMSEKQWTFNVMPDYFVWHLENQSFLDERFYITNQSGFPLRSQIIKLQNGNSATLVLFPKIDLAADTKYYIYLTTDTKDTKTTWIQPIAVNASGK
jgi:hypothetical protein